MTEEALFFDSQEAYAVWLCQSGFQYTNIKILSNTKDGITVFASSKCETPPFSTEKFFTELAKKYPLDTLAVLPLSGMIFDALDKKIPWENVIKILKEKNSGLSTSTYYKLWKEDRETFNLFRGDAALGWKTVPEIGARFLCTVEDEEFIKLVFSECTVERGKGDVLIHAVKTNARIFIKYATPTKVTGVFIMNLYKAGMIELIPKLYESNLGEEQKEIFLQYLIFHDVPLVKKLIPGLKKKINPTFLYSIKVLGEDEIINQLKELNLTD